MDKMTDEVRLEYWADVVQRCNTSGMSKKQWCIENDIHEKQFYYWQRRVRKLIYNEQKSVNKFSPAVFAEIPVSHTGSIVEISRENNHVGENLTPTVKLSKGRVTIEISNLTALDLMTFTRELLRDA